jgi:hypothetical protein
MSTDLNPSDLQSLVSEFSSCMGIDVTRLIYDINKREMSTLLWDPGGLHKAGKTQRARQTVGALLYIFHN